jgi:3,4-dihydroxy 2-butanone 4-phosphate synthase/GTP cyclohydrolase II
MPTDKTKTRRSAQKTDVNDWLSQLGVPRVDTLSKQARMDRPIHGTTLYVASCTLDTRFGPFRAHVFQDLIHKGYVIALTHGNLGSGKALYTRIHSSCVTSETLRGCDCDCVQQLEGALETIAQRKHGILFYLMQEGRGVGYIAKARDRMLVQASQDQISTFQAYAAMGLKKDYRDYEDVMHAATLLGLKKARFILLTNNPDKIEAMRAQGLKVVRAEPIEFEPSPLQPGLSGLQSHLRAPPGSTQPHRRQIDAAAGAGRTILSPCAARCPTIHLHGQLLPAGQTGGQRDSADRSAIPGPQG